MIWTLDGNGPDGIRSPSFRSNSSGSPKGEQTCRGDAKRDWRGFRRNLDSRRAGCERIDSVAQAQSECCIRHLPGRCEIVGATETPGPKVGRGAGWSGQIAAAARQIARSATAVAEYNRAWRKRSDRGI